MHRTFGAVRAATQREPITFDFGLYGEETFTVIPTPTLGDTFDLYDAPEHTPENLLDSARILARFIRRMLADEDRPRFDAALYRIPADQLHVIVECAEWIAEQVAGFPTSPSTTSSGGRRRSGRTSKKQPGGGARSN